jgi:hypothetical protein
MFWMAREISIRRAANMVDIAAKFGRRRKGESVV